MIKAWQPSASMEALQRRAALLKEIRNFFAERGVWEVSTPVLSKAGITDPNIHSLMTTVAAGQSPQSSYLQTSPEFPMKRLLAAGSGAIYQICPVFRDGEIGSRHNPEFTMLEWYRPGFTQYQLMDEVEALLKICLPDKQHSPKRISYRDAFQQAVGLDPFTASQQDCLNCCKQQNIVYPESMAAESECPLDTWLDLMLSHRVAATFPTDRATILMDYPATQAALAKKRVENNVEVASRFEVFWGELEIGNGFHELTDASEQRQRFEQENLTRHGNGQPIVRIDEHLLGAMQAGLPECAGIAIGIERLLMIMLNASHISEVMAFPYSNA